MTNVTVTSSGTIGGGNRVVVRTSGDRVYVIVGDATDRIEIWKGNQNGEPTSFSEVESLTETGILEIVGAAVAIDGNNDIHITWETRDTAHGGVLAQRYRRFDTGTDAWDISAETIATFVDNAFFTKIFAICVDGNNDPHVAYNDNVAFMGNALDTIFYANKIGGSWNTKVQVFQETNESDVMSGIDIFIGEPTSTIGADRPIILISNQQVLNAYHGGALNATSFTEQVDVTGTINLHTSTTTAHISSAIDSGGKITVSFTENTSFDLMIVEHLASNGWSTWETPADVDTSRDYFNSNIAIDGTNRYIFSRSSGDVFLWKDEGSGFSEETADADLPNVGTFGDPTVKWSSKNNNSPTELDYVFEDGSGISYNTFSTVAVAVGVLFPPIVNSSTMI